MRLLLPIYHIPPEVSGNEEFEFVYLISNSGVIHENTSEREIRRHVVTLVRIFIRSQYPIFIHHTEGETIRNIFRTATYRDIMSLLETSLHHIIEKISFCQAITQPVHHCITIRICRRISIIFLSKSPNSGIYVLTTLIIDCPHVLISLYRLGAE